MVGVNDATSNTQDDATSTRHPALVPWIVVGGVAILAILISIIMVNVTRSSNAEAEPAPTSEPVVVSPAPTNTASPKPTVEPEPEADTAPTVDVGNTSEMRIDQWNAVTQVSGRFGALNYVVEGETMRITSALTDSFPASCGPTMKTGWGVERVGGTTYQVVKPASKCADSPELYDQVWGLTQAMADAIKPA